MDKGDVVPFGAHGIEAVRLDAFLGRGGFGAVWAVTDVDTDQRYCLKLIQADEETDEARIRELGLRVANEASVQIPSRYVVRAIGFQARDVRNYAMLFELFENAQTLRTWLESNVRTASWPRKRGILEQALKGLAAAHLSNIVHRDIKPDNILVNDRDEVKIMDFGIGKFKHGAGGGGAVTEPGAQLGTLPYMAPEVGLDASRADCRCDVYAFGHIIYETITGQNVWFQRGWLMRRSGGILAFLDYTRKHTHLVDLDAFMFADEPLLQQVLAHSLAFDARARYASGERMLVDWFGAAARRDVIEGRPAEGPVAGGAACLLLLEGARRGARIALDLDEGGEVTLGRSRLDPGNAYLSRAHVRVVRRGDRYLLADVGSLNGTVFHGRNLDQHEFIELHHGDRVRLADTFLEFRLEVAATV